MKFRIFEIDFEITFLFAALLAFIITLNSPVSVLMTVASSLLHETGHLIAMIVFDNKPQCVRFEITGMNIKRQPSLKISTKNELLIALAGPFANCLLLVVSCIVLCFFESETVFTLSCINLILMLFNLLPIKKLDGGMALYHLLSLKYDADICSKILKVTSMAFVIVLYLWGIYIFASTNYNISVLIIALFLTLSLFDKNEY